MNAMQSLLTLLAHAERERDAALAALRGCQIEQRNAQAQAEQLQRYRRDYEQRWQTQFRASGAIEVVHCYQGFMQRLGTAPADRAARDAAAGLSRRNETPMKLRREGGSPQADAGQLRRAFALA